jgi:hypothetical protein
VARAIAAVAAGLAALLGLPAGAQAPDPARVEVTYVANPRAPAAERILQDLRTYLERRAAGMLGPGRKLSVQLLSVYRAGHRSWTPGNDGVRVVTDATPARIELAFRLRDAAGAATSEGTRLLRSPDYFVADRGGDPLRFEKALLDDWLAREFEQR